MKYPTLLALACAVASTSSFATTLPDTVSASVNYHPAIKSAAAGTQAAEHTVRQAEGGYLPQVSLGFSSGYQVANNTTIRAFQDPDGNDVWRNKADLSIRQMIYDGGNTKGAVKAAKSRLDAAGELQNERTHEVILAAATAHLEVLRAQELVALATANVEAHESYVSDIRERAEQGVITQTDKSHAEARLALAYASLMEEEEAQLVAETRYLEIVGQHSSALEKPGAVNIPYATAEEALQVALANNPTIAESAATARAADAEYSRTDSAVYPQFEFEITSSVQDTSATSDLSSYNPQSYDTFAGVNVSWDLYRGGSNRARRESAASSKVSSDELMKLAQRDTREEVVTLWNERKKLKDRIPLLDNYSTSIHDVLADYIDQFAVNRRDLLDLLDRQVESYRADSDLITAEYELMIKEYQLLHATGQIDELI